MVGCSLVSAISSEAHDVNELEVHFSEETQEEGRFMQHRWQPLACVVLSASVMGCATPTRHLEVRDIVESCKFVDPVYPRIAHVQGVEGRVVVGGIIEPDGAVSEVKLVEASRSKMLDDAALKAARLTTCAPIRDPQTGRAMRAAFARPYAFKLADDSPKQDDLSSTGLIEMPRP